MEVPDTLPESARALLGRTFGAKWQQAFFEPMRGATNLVTRVSFGYDRYAVRVPHLDDARLKIDRRSECAAIAAARLSFSTGNIPVSVNHCSISLPTRSRTTSMRPNNNHC